MLHYQFTEGPPEWPELKMQSSGWEQIVARK